MAITYHVTFNATTAIWSRTSTGIISYPSTVDHAAGGPFLVVPTVVPFDPIHETGGSFWVLKEGPHEGFLVSFWSNQLGYGDITITQSGAPPSYVTGTPKINPLAPWRLLIKGMGGLTGAPGKNMLTFNAPTFVWSRTTGGIIKWPHEFEHAAGGPYAVNPIVVPFDPVHETGGSFWRLLEGPYTGFLVSFWSNELGYGDITVEQDPDFDRGPGETLAILGPGDVVPLPSTGRGETPVPHLLGASINYNADGEVHFNLLVDDPHILIPIPKRTHYVIEFWDEETETWNEPTGGFAGWIWDFEANDEYVTFYGIDYLAAFRYTVDERFDPASPDAAQPTGSKYVNTSIRSIVVSQLEYAISRPNSMVGFIAMGTIDPMPIIISGIYSTFRNTLDFVVGLLDSHRAGTGKYTRISVRKLSGVYTVMVEDDPGVNRDHLPLRYRPGELVTGYHVIPFGTDWASRVNFLWRKRNEIKINFRTESSAIDQGVWGHIAQDPIMVETEDANDARRRALQAAIDASRLGRQIGVGLKLGSFKPGEGYDICDNLPVDINHGAVVTADWGSDAFGQETPEDGETIDANYWTILGLQWETYDDGHWMTSFNLYPKGGGKVSDSVCVNIQEQQDVWPLGVNELGQVISTTGLILYERGAVPDQEPIPGQLTGNWHFANFGEGGEGTVDFWGQSVGSILYAGAPGDCRITIKWTAGPTPNLGSGVRASLYHYEGVGGFRSPVLDSVQSNIMDGEDIVVNVSSHDGEHCMHWIRIEEMAFTPCSFGFLQYTYEPGFFLE